MLRVGAPSKPIESVASAYFAGRAGKIIFSARSATARGGAVAVPVSPRRLLDAEELDLEDEGGRRGNDGREAALAVRVVRGARQLRRLPDGHLHHPFVPSFDDLAHTDGELEGLAAVLGAVELGAVRECTWGIGGCVQGVWEVSVGWNPASGGGRRRAAGRISQRCFPSIV